MNASITIL